MERKRHSKFSDKSILLFSQKFVFLSNEIFQEIEDYSRVAQTSLRLAQLDMQSGDFVAAEQRIGDVLDIALREALHEPAIEAMELNGDLSLQRSQPERAISDYNDALNYIDRTGFVEKKMEIAMKLAHTLLDQKNFDATDPLIGYMIEQGNTSGSLKVRAHYAFEQGEIEESVALLESAQSTAADDWSDSDATTLAQYREVLKK